MRLSEQIIFFGIVFTIYAAVNYYIIRRAIVVVPENYKNLFIAISVFIILSYIIGRFLENYFLNHLTDFLVWLGPFNIESGKSLDVVFALAVGYSLDEIKDAVIQSRQKYQEILFTDMKDVEEKPNTFELFQNYPNPFNPETKISYSIPNDSHVLLKIYDMLGREVLTLVDDYQKAGYHSLRFKAEKPYIEASGIYFYRIQAGNYISVKKMLYLK